MQNCFAQFKKILIIILRNEAVFSFFLQKVDKTERLQLNFVYEPDLQTKKAFASDEFYVTQEKILVNNLPYIRKIRTLFCV